MCWWARLTESPKCLLSFPPNGWKPPLLEGLPSLLRLGCGEFRDREEGEEGEECFVSGMVVRCLRGSIRMLSDSKDRETKSEGSK